MYFSKAKQRVQIKGNHRIKLGTRQKLQLKNLTQIDAFQVRSVRLRNDNPSTSTYFIQLYPLFYVQSETNKRQQFMLYKIFLLNNADLTHAPSLKLLKPMYFQFFFFLFFFSIQTGKQRRNVNVFYFGCVQPTNDGFNVL